MIDNYNRWIYNEYILKANSYQVSSLVPIYKRLFTKKHFLLFLHDNLPVFYKMYHKQVVCKKQHYVDCCEVESFILMWIKHLQNCHHSPLASPRRVKREKFCFEP
jgi:hypothetical protein